MQPQTTALLPLMRWPGGKTKLLKAYQGLLPKYEDVESYVEPFLGAGAVFCDIASKDPRPRRYVINDSNRELASFYFALRDTPLEFLNSLALLEAQYLRLKRKEDRKGFYYACRERYWCMAPGAVDTAATLYFLMKTSFNGIWQTCVASRGLYATPAGLLNETKVFDEVQLLAWSKALRAVTFSNRSFEHVQVPSGSFVYCDPPYRGGFAKYGAAFTDVDQIRLIDWCDSLARRGCRVFLANRDLGDGFFERHLPRYCVVSRINVTYTAGRRKRTVDGFKAKRATELLVDFAGHGVEKFSRLHRASRQTRLTDSRQSS